MKIDYGHSIKELEDILGKLKEPIRGDVVKTASRLIHRLRVDTDLLFENNKGLALAVDAAYGMEAIDPIVRAHLGEAAGLVKHQMGTILNTQCSTIDQLGVQAMAMKRLSEALSILARGVTFPDIHTHGVEGIDSEGEGDTDDL